MLGTRGLANWVPDSLYLKIVYKSETGRRLDLNHPLTYTEKLQWLKLNDRRPEYATYVDKFAVRGHIQATIGSEFLIPLIGVYSSAEDVCWSDLPGSFVIKCTHGSNASIICRDKNRLDIPRAIGVIDSWLRRNWYWFGREWPYKHVVPRIVCEELLTVNGALPIDYKVMCFAGRAKLIQVHRNRFFRDHTVDFYDTEWRKTPMTSGGDSSDTVVPKPVRLVDMLALSERLARGIPHVRIDWYEVGGRLFFGEMTFFDASGFLRFDNDEDELRIGGWIPLKGWGDAAGEDMTP